MNEMQSTEVNELFKALSLAQTQIKGAVKDSTNPFLKYRYSDLTSVWDACRDALTENGLCVTQTIVCTNHPMLLTTLGHSSGQWIKSLCPINPAKQNDPQSFGAALTYMRRFSLAAMVGVCPEDDDGERERKEAERIAKEEEKKQQSIDDSQYEQLLILIGKDDEYMQKIKDFFKIDSLKYLPKDRFKQVFDSAVKYVEGKAVGDDR